MLIAHLFDKYVSTVVTSEDDKSLLYIRISAISPLNRLALVLLTPIFIQTRPELFAAPVTLNTSLPFKKPFKSPPPSDLVTATILNPEPLVRTVSLSGSLNHSIALLSKLLIIAGAEPPASLAMT